MNTGSSDHRMPPGPEAEGAPFEVLYLDNHLLVVMKPAGLLSQEDRSGDPDLVAEAKRYIKARFDRPGNVFVGLVHRLDRNVSGVMVLARTSKAASRLSKQFREGTPSKRYLALVEGRLLGAGREVAYLHKKKGVVSIVRPSHPGGKRAVLSWQSLAVSRTRSLIQISLETGRSHQIRVQLSALGHPILGDRKYGASAGFSGHQSLALHAYKLAFKHPTLKKAVTFSALPPASWSGFFDDAIRTCTGDDSFGST